MQTDIEIARRAPIRPIEQIAERLGIGGDDLEHYGKDKAKISLDLYRRLEGKSTGKLVLVTAISPTTAGEGKTTTTVGLVDGLNRIGKRAIGCIREPSLGPCFGMKGGAAGGGYAQVIPMEDINLHFTGDFHAITSDATVMSKPDSCGTELFTPPSPTMMSRRARSFISTTRRHTIRRGSMFNWLP